MKPRVLVVDDDRLITRTLCDILRFRGWEAVPAYSGEEAIATHKEDRYTYVLMDMKMAGIDGLAAYRTMKTAAPNLRVILMTAFASVEAMEKALSEGVWRVINKPIDLPALFAMLDEEQAS